LAWAERRLDAPRHPRWGGGLRAPLGEANKVAEEPPARLAGPVAEQVPLLAPPLWARQRTQRLSLERAQRLIGDLVSHCNTKRL